MHNFKIGATTCNTVTGRGNQDDWILIMGRFHFLKWIYRNPINKTVFVTLGIRGHILCTC